MSKPASGQRSIAGEFLYPILDWLVRFRKYLGPLRWQDAAKAATWHYKPGRRITITLRRGHQLTLRSGTSDFPIFFKIFTEGEYRLPFDFTPETIIDAGANIGLATVFFALNHPQSRILALEPDAGNLELLRLNTAGLPHVTIFAKALWNRNTLLTLKNDNAEPWAHQFGEGESGQVAAITVPELLEELGTEKLDLLKMDIEGAEETVFDETAAAWFDRIRVLVVEMHDRHAPTATKNLVRHLASRDFQSHIFGESMFIIFPEPGTKVNWSV